MNNRTDAVINEIEKVIIGKREVVERVLMAILSEGHILLDDVPGVGKTTLAVTWLGGYGRAVSAYAVYAGCCAVGYRWILGVQQGDRWI